MPPLSVTGACQPPAATIFGRPPFEPFFEDVPNEKPDKEMVDLAVELIERKSGKFEPEEFENPYHTALKELVDEKLKGRKIVAPLAYAHLTSGAAARGIKSIA